MARFSQPPEHPCLLHCLLSLLLTTTLASTVWAPYLQQMSCASLGFQVRVAFW